MKFIEIDNQLIRIDEIIHVKYDRTFDERINKYIQIWLRVNLLNDKRIDINYLDIDKCVKDYHHIKSILLGDKNDAI